MKKISEAIRDRPGGEVTWPSGEIRYPGLIAGAEEIQQLARALSKSGAVFSYKQLSSYLWVVFIGGTGTGKSTLFNTLCGTTLSGVGVERPKTTGPVLYAHRDCPVEEGFPFASIGIERRSADDSLLPATGSPGQLTVLEHVREDLSHIIVVDTPDLDSVESENRQIAEDLYLLSDIVVFVTSQEKYADDVPYQFFQRIIQEKKPAMFLLNKARKGLAKGEILSVFQNQGVSFDVERMWLIPYVFSSPAQAIPEQPSFHEFLLCFHEDTSGNRMDAFRKKEHSRLAGDLKRQADRLLDLLEQENRAARKWLTRLEALYRETAQNLIKEEKGRFAEKRKEYLGTEIRKLFAKYDVLAKPRRFIREVLLSPFRLLGFSREPARETRREELLRARQKTDLSSIRAAMEKFNRRVLEELSPRDRNSPLFSRLRESGAALTDEEITTRNREAQDELAAWLENTFQELSRSIPEGKKWGIYTTSILWGVLILSFETVLGGGFSLLDAALDSALAPFVTKGAVELFAYHEIQKIARELAKRYQEGLVSTVLHQRERYEQRLKSLMTPRETLAALEEFALDMEKNSVTVHRKKNI